MRFNILLSLVMTVSSVHSSWYAEKESGWFWYKKEPVVDPLKPTKKPKQSSAEPKISYTQRLKTLKADVAEAQARAVLEPTFDNITHFRHLQDRLIRQASLFSERWMLSAQLTPTGFRDQDHTAATHRHIFEATKNHRLDQKITALAQTHGLFFVVKKGCSYCHHFAPLVHQFAKTYGFEIKIIIAGESDDADFPTAVPDNGTVSVINPQGIFPALFVVDPVNQQVNPIAWGMVSLSQLRENIERLLTHLEKNHA